MSAPRVGLWRVIVAAVFGVLAAASLAFGAGEDALNALGKSR